MSDDGGAPLGPFLGGDDGERDDATTASTPMARLLDRAGRVLAGMLAVMLVLPVAAWAVDTLIFSRLGEGVAEAAPALADAVALVNRRGCDGRTGSGSGFAVTYEGRPAVVTNRHVVESSAVVGVRTLSGGAGPDVVEVLLSQIDDVAVLVLDRPLGAELALGRPATIGDQVRLVGFPGARPVTSTGRVSDSDNRRMLLDVEVDPGASGAPLVDDRDRVVAQVVARTEDGLGVAIPAGRLGSALRRLQPAAPCP